MSRHAHVVEAAVVKVVSLYALLSETVATPKSTSTHQVEVEHIAQ